MMWKKNLSLSICSTTLYFVDIIFPHENNYFIIFQKEGMADSLHFYHQTGVQNHVKFYRYIQQTLSSNQCPIYYQYGKNSTAQHFTTSVTGFNWNVSGFFSYISLLANQSHCNSLKRKLVEMLHSKVVQIQVWGHTCHLHRGGVRRTTRFRHAWSEQ